MAEKLNNKPKIVILTSRTWNEWIAKDERILEFAETILIIEKEHLTINKLNEIDPKYIFVPHWSFIIPSEIYERFNTVIFHMTDLPYGRGGSPLQNLILAGHDRTRLSAIKCVKEMDSGPIFLKVDLNLYGTAEEIFIRASKVIHSMILTMLEHEISPVPQIGDITFFKRRKPEESNLDLIKDPSEESLYNFIRMLDAPGYPRAFVRLGDQKIEFSKVFQTEEGLQGIFNIKKV